MALKFLEEYLRRELERIGRADLMAGAVGGIGFTDDGSTIYVHLFPGPAAARRPGRAYVLAWQDYAEDPSQRLDCFRWLVREAKLNIRDHVHDIVRWLEAR
ncbi:hypothetical protein HRbin24_00247 [bacterium HR24]|jgi:hypothetical protein|nr:hypothetical protein HRbin24_00247 [bacterium HR24]